MSLRAPWQHGSVCPPPSVMQHAVRVGCDSWMRFGSHSFRSLPPRPSDHHVFGLLEVTHLAPAGVLADTIVPVASDGGLHLRYEGAVGVTLSDEPQILAVNRSGSLALTGYYLVDTMPQSVLPAIKEHFVFSERQVLPFVGAVNWSWVL